MATRFYIRGEAPSFNPTTFRGTWDSTASQEKSIHTLKFGARAQLLSTAAHDADYDRVMLRLTSEPVLDAVTLTAGVDTWQSIIQVFEAGANWNAVTHLHVFVTEGDTDTVRGTLIDNAIASPLASEEWNTFPLTGNLFNNS